MPCGGELPPSGAASLEERWEGRGRRSGVRQTRLFKTYGGMRRYGTGPTTVVAQVVSGYARSLTRVGRINKDYKHTYLTCDMEKI